MTGKQANTIHAVETCSGTVRDATGNIIPQVVVSVHLGNAGQNYSQRTNNNDEYSFPTYGFGSGALLIKEVLFEKAGFQTLFIDTSSPPNDKCPGNVVLSAPPLPTQTGYVCDPDQGCTFSSSNTQYAMLDACGLDCKKERYEPSQNSCKYPDTKYHSQSLECSKVPLTPGGVLGPTLTPTPIPPLPPCAQWVDQNNKPLSKESAIKTDIKKCLSVDTGLGIPLATDPVNFVKSIFGIILSLSGGVALLLIILSGYKLMLSQGNPEKAQEAKETLTAAIVGLLFIIFSLVILQVIGVDILKIPGFGK